MILQNINGIISNLNSGLRPEMWTPDIPNTKQECYPLDRDVRYTTTAAIIDMRTDLVKSMIQQSGTKPVIFWRRIHICKPYFIKQVV
jgi:hypothetical protein